MQCVLIAVDKYYALYVYGSERSILIFNGDFRRALSRNSILCFRSSLPGELHTITVLPALQFLT